MLTICKRGGKGNGYIAALVIASYHIDPADFQLTLYPSDGGERFRAAIAGLAIGGGTYHIFHASGVLLAVIYVNSEGQASFMSLNGEHAL